MTYSIPDETYKSNAAGYSSLIRTPHFKLVPLLDNGDPAVKWGPIYENPEYWTPEKLRTEGRNCKNIGTVFGKTRDGLYLNCLDIDSNTVYDILFSSSSFIVNALENTFVVKTEKKTGYHIYWLSQSQNKPIHKHDCRPGYEFEIKTDKSSGMTTLPPSNHRNNNGFTYQVWSRSDNILVKDELYDELLLTLKDCLKSSASKVSEPRAVLGDLKDSEVKELHSIISPFYKNGYRYSLVLGISGFLHKAGISKDTAIALVDMLAKDDEELKSRLIVVEETYDKDPKTVSGTKYFLSVLESVVGDNARDVLDRIIQVVSRGKDVVLWLTNTIMKEHIFKTVEDGQFIQETYYWDDKDEIYKVGAEPLVQRLCELIRPEITTHEVQEIINKIKRRTLVPREDFTAANPNIIDVENGLLCVLCGDLRPHTPEFLSLNRIPVTYDPKAKCPEWCKFLCKILKLKDVQIVLQYIGYCLYRTAKYEKAIMCVGKGDNGKGTLLKAIGRFVGEKNTSHVSLQDMNQDKFAIADMYGKLVNAFADLSSEKLPSTGNFKMLVSGDPIRAQRKHGQPFNFSNYSKFWFSANEIPQSDDKTYAFFKRWIILHFEQAFIGQNADRNLIDKLCTKDEFSGLLNLALIRLGQLIKDNGFINADGVETVRLHYDAASKGVEAFLRDRCNVNVGNAVWWYEPSDRLYGEYAKYCGNKKPKVVPLSDNMFGTELAQLGIINKQKMVKGERGHYYFGLQLKEEEI
jgi:putative DNA primase/helicase